MRIIFMGTPDFARPVLAALIAAGHDIACVYAQPPRAAQRGKRLQAGAVQTLAQAHGLMIRTPETLRNPAAVTEFADLKAEIAVVAAYGMILPQAVLDAPTLGCLNVHASLLPRWRGAAPVHRAIEAGDAQTGVCIMQMEAGLDTGPVLLRRATAIDAHDTTGSLMDRLAGIGAELCVEALDRHAELPAVPQLADGITYARKIDKAESQLDFSVPADVLERRIRAFNPAPGAWAELGGERIRVLAAACLPGDPVAEPGQILDSAMTIQCGQGTALQPVVLQRAGRTAVPLADFLRGFAVPVGVRVGMQL